MPYYSSVKVNILRPGFEYPESSFVHYEALYYPSKDIVFIVTRLSSTYEDDISEVNIWEPDEIRLLATLTLSVSESGGWVAYVPWDFSFTVIPSVPKISMTLDLSTDNAISFCLDYARGILAKKQGVSTRSYILRSQQSLPRSDAKTEKAIFEKINLSNNLLIRGLYHLIKCPLLISTYQDYPLFLEEAFVNLQISTEAAIQIIRGRLRTEENPNPSIKDVYSYIQSSFTKNASWVDYLEEQYAKWIETKHPLSGRAQPSLVADDIYETYGTLISIYRHIVLGEPGWSSSH